MTVVRVQTYYTQDAFQSAPKPLANSVSHCMFAHEKKAYSLAVPEELVYCVAWQAPGPTSGGGASRDDKEFRLYSSRDFFQSESIFVDLGIGKDARGVVGVGGVTKYIVTALKPNANSGGDMLLYVTQDGKDWHRAMFPHGHGLKENAYTIVESTDHSILVDVNTAAGEGTLFTSNSDGTNFVRSLDHTNRNQYGLVDFEKVVGVEGIAIINTVANSEDATHGAEKQLKTRITFDDGGHWSLLSAPGANIRGQPTCDTSDIESCSLHLHSVTQPHNYGRVFSSTVPGFIMGVGSVGSRLLSYEESDTFLSIDGGISWKMVAEGAHKYEFGGEGSLLVMVDDEAETNVVKYSFDFGQTWSELDIGVTVRARLLTTINDSTGLKFMLLGTLARKDESSQRHTIVFLDFLTVGKRKCNDQDREKWYARKIGGVEDCLMGHKQYYHRRRPNADCVVQNKFNDPKVNYENCACAAEDFECDFNFALEGETCMLVGPERIPAGQCARESDKFEGSSGYRLIPGNTCHRSKGAQKDDQVTKPCSAGQATPGLVSHQVNTIPGTVLDQAYLSDRTLVAFTSQNKVWQSPNEGFSWGEVAGGVYVVSMTIHAYVRDRAYLITSGRTVHFTTTKGSSWSSFMAPTDPNGLAIPTLDFHPLRDDWLIWTGQEGCSNNDDQSKCRAIAHYSTNNGRSWNKVDEYVRLCTWARDTKLKLDEKLILCESFKTKSGNQRAAFATGNQLQLISGGNYYSKKTILFDNIVGFATFEEYMVVAEMSAEQHGIALKVSLDGQTFAQTRFPPGMHLENQAYTVLESVTDSVFLHVTTRADYGSEWGALFKSNSNGTYYSLSLDNVNRNSAGFVDFEKMLGLDGIALINIVSNADEAAQSGQKKLQTRITHNDGGYWKPLVQPKVDALGQPYQCTSTACSLHIHGYTERRDPRATYSSPSAVGLMIGVGNVGETLAPYTESDTFLTRDGGFTWEEIHKDAHIWEYGDQGSILVLANDEDVTDHVTYSLNEGLSWQDYNFGQKIRVSSIVTVPADTSRKFIVFGIAPGSQGETVAVHLDFSSVTNVKCKLDMTNPDTDDFEMWSPSEEREEQCLFGEQVYFHRRIRDRNCYVGEKLPAGKREKFCACTEEDFECEFNYQRNAKGDCVLAQDAQPLENVAVCPAGEDFWYERTSRRKVPHSKCEGGLTYLGAKHDCPGAGKRGFFFWATITLSPFLIAGLAAVWWTRRRGGGGRIRLPEPGEGAAGGLMDLALSVPWFLIGVAGVMVERVKEWEGNLPDGLQRLLRRGAGGQRGGYRSLHVDDDAELLQDYDDEE